jgi:hypothetical protein
MALIGKQGWIEEGQFYRMKKIQRDSIRKWRQDA